jgi:hypothetical protein
MENNISPREQIALCVIVGNEPKRLNRCLSLFAPAVGEMCVVHAHGNTPADLEVARVCERHGAKLDVYTNAPGNAWDHVDDFSAARQKSFDIATKPWALWVDSDDVPGQNFAAALHELLATQGDKFDAFALYHDVAGRGIAHNLRERLVRRDKGRWVNRIHENFQLDLGAKMAQCDAPVVVHLPDDEPKQGNNRNVTILESIPEAERTVSEIYHLHGEYMGLGRKAEAIALAKQALAHPDLKATERYELCLNIAEITRPEILQTGTPEYQAMLTALHHAYRTSPNRREALALLGAMHMDLGDLVTAEAYLRAMMALPRPVDKPWTHRDGLYGCAGEGLWTQWLRMTGQTEKADAIERARLEAHKLTISVCHPTRGRAHQAAMTRKRWLDAAANPERIEYIFGFSADDEESVAVLSRFRHAVSPAGNLERIGGTAVQNYNAATNAATGRIIVTAQDDVFPPLHWDKLLEEKLAGHVAANQPAILQIRDGYRNDDLMVTFCVTRPTFAALGYGAQNILCPEYAGVFSDTEFSLRAQKSGLLVPSDIVFKHEHPFWNPAIPSDATYVAENSDAAFQAGETIFRRRNPDLVPAKADTAPSA